MLLNNVVKTITNATITNVIITNVIKTITDAINVSISTPLPNTPSASPRPNQLFSHLFSKELAVGGMAPECRLYGLDLHGDGREHCLLQSVELIKAAPGATLDQANEYASHGLDVYTLENGEFIVSHLH